MMQGILDSMSDPLSLTNGESGKYVYMNEAFVHKFGKGLNLRADFGSEEIFQKNEAALLKHADEMCIASGKEFSQDISLTTGHAKAHMQVLKSLLNMQETVHIVSVYRDVSLRVDIEKKNVQTSRQIIDALVRAVESAPFLEGRTSLMRLIAIEIADVLLLGTDDITTVEAAAILSQIGKSFIPKEIMQKQGKLSPEELAEMQRYVEHTCNILEGIEFNLPIRRTIYQMQECLDGSGYPQGLQGDEISQLAGILGVANTFSAMVQSGGYREPKTAILALGVFENMANVKYDRNTVEALRTVIMSARGQTLLTQNNVRLR